MGVLRHYCRNCISFVLVLILSVFLYSCGAIEGESGSGTTIKGTAADDPLTGANVSVYDDNGEFLGGDITGSAGEYSIDVHDRELYELYVDGGTIAGKSFESTFRNICTKSSDCDATPLTTLAVEIMETYGMSWANAKDKAHRAIGLDIDDGDPFALDAEGNPIEGFEPALEYLRSEMDNGTDVDNWIANVMDNMTEPYNGTVTGTASISEALSGAELKLYIGDSSFSAQSDYNGSWKFSGGMALDKPFRLVTSGGTLDGESFDGSLSAYVPFMEFGNTDEENSGLTKDININIFTTLVDRLMLDTGIDYESAKDSVRRFFAIPKEADLSDKAVIDEFLSPEWFETASEDNYGFDFLAESMVEDMDTESRLLSTANKVGGDYRLIKASFGTKIFDGVVGGLASGAIGFALSTAFQYLAPAMGIETKEAKTERLLEEILSTLNEVNEKIDKLSDDTKEILKKLDYYFEKSIGLAAINHAEVAAAKINSSFRGFLSANTPEKMALYMSELPDIDTELEIINTLMYESALGTDAGLDHLTESYANLMLRTDDAEERGQILWDSYKAIEGYFTRVMAIQVKGSLIMVNKLNYRDNNLGVFASHQGERSYYSSGEDYINNVLNPRFKKQAEHFLECVEQLVAASADTRTMIAVEDRGFSMFPSTVDDVFYMADLITQEFIPEHKAAFVYRIAGDPDIINNYLRGPNSHKFKNYTILKINGKGTRYYKARTPEEKDFYLGWSLNRNSRWEFTKNTKIAFIKIRFDKMEGYLEAKKDSDFPFTRIYIFKDKVEDVVFFDIVDPRSGAKNPGGVRYANCLAEARTVPWFNFGNDTEVHKREGSHVGGYSQGYSSFNKKVYMEHLSASLGTSLLAKWGRLDTQQDMYMELVNKTGSSFTMDFDGLVNEKVTTNKVGDPWMIIDVELHWQVKAGSENICSREFQRSNSSFTEVKGNHDWSYSCEGSARWNKDQQRQLYFRASRNRIEFSANSVYSNSRLHTEFITKMVDFEYR
ncbi:hypothetical protein [Limisalsivibrio acetivorans]|uniref:hypothetical protein n=1 Tax=Limisalsivibrio acetivorans TaxID=1304888 RepID=UPI0003B72F04|nr:hypothetical protein [Limisalsivibrio acetivorans]